MEEILGVLEQFDRNDEAIIKGETVEIYLEDAMKTLAKYYTQEEITEAMLHLKKTDRHYYNCLCLNYDRINLFHYRGLWFSIARLRPDKAFMESRLQWKNIYAVRAYIGCFYLDHDTFDDMVLFDDVVTISRRFLEKKHHKRIVADYVIKNKLDLSKIKFGEMYNK